MNSATEDVSAGVGMSARALTTQAAVLLEERVDFVRTRFLPTTLAELRATGSSGACEHAERLETLFSCRQNDRSTAAAMLGAEKVASTTEAQSTETAATAVVGETATATAVVAEVAAAEVIAEMEADKLARKLFTELEAIKHWPSPAHREAFIFARLRAALAALASLASSRTSSPLTGSCDAVCCSVDAGAGDDKAGAAAMSSLYHLDSAHIAGAPSELTSEASRILSPAAQYHQLIMSKSTAAATPRTATATTTATTANDHMATNAVASATAAVDATNSEEDTSAAALPSPGWTPDLVLAPPRQILRLPELLGDTLRFITSFYRKERAVVIPGAASVWPALKKWPNLDWLRAHHGHRLVPIELGVHGQDGWCERVMKLEHLVTNYLAARYPAASTTATASSSDNNGCGSGGSGGGSDGGRRIAYLAQHALLRQIPELADDIIPPVHMWNSLPGARVQSINAWVGTTGTVSPLHFDADDNFLVQLAGFKYVRIYARDQTPNLYVHKGHGSSSSSNNSSNVSAGNDSGKVIDGVTTSTVSAGGLKQEEKKESIDEEEEEEEGKEMLSARNSTYAQGNISSVVNVEKPDAKAFPLFARCRRYKECVLGPGDMLFVPAGMWHYVRALDAPPDYPSYSMSINFFFRTDETVAVA